MLRAVVDRLAALVEDLRTTQQALHDVLAELAPGDWAAPTPSAGWDVRAQVRHLAHGEGLSRLAATDADGFVAELQRLLSDLDAVEAATTGPSDEPDANLLTRWADAAAGVRAAIAAGPPDERIPWVTGPMSRPSFATARVMETFAHGHDIGVAVGRSVPHDAALPHVAHLGASTRAFAYVLRGLPVPDTPVRVVLEDPDLVFGPDDAPATVRGRALDFCLLVTQRIHRDDTTLVARGPHAEEWLAIAQCFAGGPTDGPPATRV